MNKLLAGLFLLSFSVTSYAASDHDTDADGLVDMFKDYCAAVASSAEASMNMRQAGVSITDALKIYINSDNRNSSELMIRATTDAYSQPKYSTHEYQYRAARELGTKYYIECLKNHDWLTNPD